eukprot:3681868-Pyramimonas_sp.AAC.1
MARLGGGIRQSLGLGKASLTRAYDELNPDAQLVAHRVENFAKKKFKSGQMSASDYETLRAIAGGPQESSQPNNAHRRVIRDLRKASALPEVYEAEISLWNADSREKTTDVVYFLLPHEVFLSECKDPAGWTDLGNSPLHNSRDDWLKRVGQPGPASDFHVVFGVTKRPSTMTV